jgi:hypothetical protein
MLYDLKILGDTVSLVAHLSSSFRTDEENVAISALGYILGCSLEASSALSAWLATIAPQVPKTLLYRTQAVGSAKERPDLAGRTEAGALKALVEAKFWAGLTPNQPVTYLKSLPEGGILLFVVPLARFATIWNEIHARCADAGLPIENIQQSAELWSAGAGGRSIAMTSWRHLMDLLGAALRAAGRHGEASDVEQLRALTERMDDSAFLPLSEEETSSQAIPRRLLNLFALVDDINRAALAEGIAGKKDRGGGGLRNSQGRGRSGWYMRLGVADIFLRYDTQLWAEFGQSPVWLSFVPEDVEGMTVARERLAAWKYARPQRLYEKGGLHVPIRLLTGQESQAVVRNVLNQLIEIRGILVAEPAIAAS